MSLIVILKPFYFLALFFIGGLGVWRSLLFKEHLLVKEWSFAAVQKAMFKLVRIGLVALALLGITGFNFYCQFYDRVHLAGSSMWSSLRLGCFRARWYLSIPMRRLWLKCEGPDLKIMKIVLIIARFFRYWYFWEFRSLQLDLIWWIIVSIVA